MSSPEQTLLCPKCGEAIKLTESLAAPLVAATRDEYEGRLRDQASSFDREKQVLSEQRIANELRAAQLEADAKTQQQAIDKAVELKVLEQITEERKQIADREATRIRNQYEDELTEKQRESDAQAMRIATLTEKLNTSQQAEAELLKKKQELEDKEREYELNLQKGISAGLETARIQALREAQESSDLKLQDRENTIRQLTEQITSLQRKAEQGSQQSQGESLELMLEDQLRASFPFDLIEPVAKGEFGGDVLQVVRDQAGFICGRILWESKRTKSWSDSWINKLKGDQRSAHADAGVIVSQAMPKDIEHFDQMEGVWVTGRPCLLPVATALRLSLIEMSKLRRSNDGQETKAQQVYAYLTGPRFKHRVECIAEKFTELRADLDAERKWMNKQWAKRDRELTTVLEATSGMYGDLQGIAGQTLRDIDALEGPMHLQLDSGETPNSTK
jgi:hypothetical protein